MTGRILLLALLAQVLVLAQQPTRDSGAVALTGTAVIGGVVTADEPNGRPVRRAAVSVTTSDMPGGRMAVTDDEGRFVVAGLPAGRYTLRAEKPGWVVSYYGAKRSWRPPGVAIAVADGQRVTNVAMKLMRGAVVTGRIVDENSQPMPGVRPMVMEYRTLGVQQTLMRVTGSMTGVLPQTDDRGEYRIFGLPPGPYVVGAAPSPLLASGFRLMTPAEVQWALPGPGLTPTGPPPQGGPSVGYATVYFPGTADPSAAQMVTLTAGEERSGVDFAVRSVPTANVEGTLTRPDGQPAVSARVMLVPANRNEAFPLDFGLVNTNSVTDPRGRFTFRNIRPGQYSLSARASSRAVTPPAPGPRPGAAPLDLWASADVSVSGQNIEGLALVLQPGLTIAGRAVFEASTNPPPTDLTRSRVYMSPPPSASGLMVAELNYSTTPLTAEGTFTLPGIAPGAYMLSASAPAPPGSAPGVGWLIKSVVVKGRDIADSAFEVRPGEDVADIVITFTDRSGEISGLLLDAAGRAAPEYYVFVFPTDKTLWTPGRRFRTPVRPGNDGRFRVTALPPGEYYLAALTDFDEKDMLDASFIEQIVPAALRIKLSEGEKRVQDLKIASGGLRFEYPDAAK
jgi:Carboxypeptidase regulatory-like domain